MIYFAPEVNRRLIGQFHQSLEEGGWLVVGASEYNLENYKVFRTVTAAGARVYQKAAVSARQSRRSRARRSEHRASASRASVPRWPRASDSLAGADVTGLRQLARPRRMARRG